ncbi:hypothetical protein [Pontibacter oryzae]|uniref:Uncharacterized protein n=1 Tax=Pontibacter oryzae TaxID=2304593 RepID=A0A399S363_9BACT|nr:hypothetical protein [Pontibacter oryzae]RIJ36973.1 hypothetical protein D1627_14230 [Pontibacter oryzae]
MKLKTILIALACLLVVWFMYDALSQPSVNDLEGNFKEIAMYRNENNTGPITRIYAVTVEDTLWAQMQAYGDFMPHTKYGNTKVYYFLNTKPLPPEVYPGKLNFEERFQQYTVAKYEKDAMGQVLFVRFPYR